MYLLITFELTKNNNWNKTHEKIYKLFENKFGFKRIWQQDDLPGNTMVDEFTGVEPYMQIYVKLRMS
jgi:hypothetical protein